MPAEKGYNRRVLPQAKKYRPNAVARASGIKVYLANQGAVTLHVTVPPRPMGRGGVLDTSTADSEA